VLAASIINYCTVMLEMSCRQGWDTTLQGSKEKLMRSFSVLSAAVCLKILSRYHIQTTAVLQQQTRTMLNAVFHHWQSALLCYHSLHFSWQTFAKTRIVTIVFSHNHWSFIHNGLIADHFYMAALLFVNVNREFLAWFKYPVMKTTKAYLLRQSYSISYLLL